MWEDEQEAVHWTLGMPSLKVERGFPRGAALSCDLKVSRGVGQLRCGWGRRGAIGKQERKEGTVASEGKQPVIGESLGLWGPGRRQLGCSRSQGHVQKGLEEWAAGGQLRDPRARGRIWILSREHWSIEKPSRVLNRFAF